MWMWVEGGGWGTRCDVDTVGVVASAAARADGNAIPVAAVDEQRGERAVSCDL